MNFLRNVVKSLSVVIIVYLACCQLKADSACPVPEYKKSPLVSPQLLYSDQAVSLFACSAAVKILPEQSLAGAENLIKENSIQVSGAKNEKEQFLLVISPKVDLKNVRLEFSDLKGPVTVSNKACSYQIAKNIFIPQRSYMYAMYATQQGWIPDPLVEGKPFTAPKNLNTSLLVTLDIAKSLAPGDYSGSIDFICGGKVYAKLPLKLTVWDITLPEKRRFQTRVHEGGAANIHMFGNKPLAKRMQADGVTALKYGAYGLGIKYNKENKSLKLDTEEYYKQCRFLLDECGFRYVTLPPKFLIRRKPLDYLGTGIEVGSSEFWPLFKDYMSQMRAFYKKHGWENKVIFGICDEEKPENYPLIIRIAQDAKKYFPEVKTLITSTRSITDELAKAVDIVCPNWSILAFGDDAYLKWRKYKKQYGRELWSYQNAIFHINHLNNPGMLRFYPSVNVKYGSSGILWYNLGYNRGGKDFWTKAPYQYKYKPNQKKKVKQQQYQFGGGQFLYPPREHEPYIHSSLRWEAYCRGLEDAELLLILKDKIEEAGKVLGASSSEEFSADYLIDGWGSLLTDKFRCRYYRPDASYIQRFRTLVAHEILNISKPPLALVSFKENQLWNTKSDFITLLIKCKDAAKIKVNGTDIAASPDKKNYSYRYKLKEGNNFIVIEITDKNGNSKKLYREVFRPMTPKL